MRELVNTMTAEDPEGRPTIEGGVHTGSKFIEQFQAPRRYHTQKWFQTTHSVYQKCDS